MMLSCYILTELYPSGKVCCDLYIVIHDMMNTVNILITRPSNVRFLFRLEAHLITVDVTFTYPNIICLIDVPNTSQYAYDTITIMH